MGQDHINRVSIHTFMLPDTITWLLRSSHTWNNFRFVLSSIDRTAEAKATSDLTYVVPDYVGTAVVV